MALKINSWLKNEVLREYLSGEPQEGIANKLNISVGTVNNIVSEFIKLDDTIDLQRQIAIVAKKNGVDIMQIAANLRFKNKIKLSSLDDRKIEKFLDGMELLFNKFNISASTAEKKLFSIIEMMLRDNIDPQRLEEEIKTKNAEMELSIGNLEVTKRRVQRKQEQLKVKEKNLQQFGLISRILDLFNAPEFSTEYGNLARAMIGIKNLGYDPEAVVAAYNKSENLLKENETTETRLQELEKTLESYEIKLEEQKASWADHYDAIEIIKSLLRDGICSEDIFMAVHVLKNDFTKKDIDQLIQDIRTYGSIAAARSKLQRQYEAETGTMF